MTDTQTTEKTRLEASIEASREALAKSQARQNEESLASMLPALERRKILTAEREQDAMRFEEVNAELAALSKLEVAATEISAAWTDWLKQGGILAERTIAITLEINALHKKIQRAGDQLEESQKSLGEFRAPSGRLGAEAWDAAGGTNPALQPLPKNLYQFQLGERSTTLIDLLIRKFNRGNNLPFIRTRSG